MKVIEKTIDISEAWDRFIKENHLLLKELSK